jgi:hypothetical protein
MNEVVYGHPVEIISFVPGKSLGIPMALLTIRLHPEQNLSLDLLMFNREQCVRMRDSLDDFLNDKDSWIYISHEEQKALRLEKQ